MVDHSITHADGRSLVAGFKTECRLDVYKLLQTLPYFKLTFEEFQLGIQALRQQQEEMMRKQAELNEKKNNLGK